MVLEVMGFRGLGFNGFGFRGLRFRGRLVFRVEGKRSSFGGWRLGGRTNGGRTWNLERKLGFAGIWV